MISAWREIRILEDKNEEAGDEGTKKGERESIKQEARRRLDTKELGIC